MKKRKFNIKGKAKGAIKKAVTVGDWKTVQHRRERNQAEAVAFEQTRRELAMKAKKGLTDKAGKPVKKATWHEQMKALQTKRGELKAKAMYGDKKAARELVKINQQIKNKKAIFGSMKGVKLAKQEDIFTMSMLTGSTPKTKQGMKYTKVNNPKNFVVIQGVAYPVHKKKKKKKNTDPFAVDPIPNASDLMSFKDL